MLKKLTRVKMRSMTAQTRPYNLKTMAEPEMIIIGGEVRWGEVRDFAVIDHHVPWSPRHQTPRYPPAPWRMREALVADQTAAWLIQNPGRDLNKCFPLSDVWSGGCGQFYFNINSKGFVLWISSRAPRLLWSGIIEIFSNEWSREIWSSKYIFLPKICLRMPSFQLSKSG